MVANQPKVTTAGAVQRVIFLGASNLARGFRPIAEEAHSIFGSPLEMIFVLGHGRSYGSSSSVLGRQLPAILHCRMWKELSRRPPLPTTAFLTDVGNDLLYMRTPVTVSAWVETALARLTSNDASTYISTLPAESVSRLHPAVFYLFRSSLFPKSKLTFDAAQQRIAETNEFISRAAEKHGATMFRHAPECYGIDPIHLRRSQQRAAWRTVLLASRGKNTATTDRVPNNIPRPRPRYRRLWGVPQRSRQPHIRLDCGTSISIY